MIRSSLVAFAFFAFAVFIFKFRDSNVEVSFLQERLLDLSIETIEMKLEKLVETSLRTADSPELIRYAEIAKKLGGYVGFDSEQKKIVVAVRKDSEVKVAILTLPLKLTDVVYYICDPSGTVLDAFNKSMVGKNVELVLPDSWDANPKLVKYEGRRYLFKKKDNERFGFKIFVGIVYVDFRIQYYLIAAVAIVLFLVGISSARRPSTSEKTLARLIADIVEKHRFDEKSVKDAELREQLSKLASKFERNERMLRDTVKKLEILKQTLEKRRTGS